MRGLLKWTHPGIVSRWFAPPVLLLLASLSASAQLKSIEDQFVVTAWQTDSGLPHNFVTSVEQTLDGYLWIGTSNGLARFDGVRFTAYRSTDYPGLRDNSIRTLYEDRAGTLWIGTEQGGLTKYSQRTFVSVPTSDGSSAHSILCILENRAGELWVGTSSGVSKSDPNKSFFQSEVLSGNPVYAVSQLPQSLMIFASSEGIQQLRQQRVERHRPELGMFLNRPFFCVLQDFQRRLWAGGPDGLIRIDPSGDTSMLHSSELLGAAVTDVLRTSDRRIWFGTSAGDLFTIAPEGSPTEAALVARFPTAITSLHVDNERNVWIGTAGSGLCRVKKRQLRWMPFPDSGVKINCVFETPEGKVHLLGEKNELYQAQRRTFGASSRLPLPEGVIVQTICSSRPGEIWFGTRSDGLFKIAGATIRQFSERDGLSDSAVTALCASKKGMYVGTRNGGLNLLTDKTVTRFNTPWGYTGNYASVLEESRSSEDLWIGTTGDGLFRLSNGVFTSYGVTNGLPDGNIGCLWAEEDGSVWIGTRRGLFRLKNDLISRIPSPNRIEEEAVVQLRADDEGNLWVGSSSGIYRYRKDQLTAYADGDTRFLDVVPYGPEDGLPIVQCVPRILSSGMHDPRSRPLFVTSRGIVISDDLTLQMNSDPPPVIIEGVLLDNEPAPLSSNINVPAGTASIQFQFTATSLTSPGKVAFRYLMEGLDSDWSDVAPTRTARYPRFAPGTYTFRVVARNNDGFWNETGSAVTLIVAPFWWQTHWFRFGMILLLGSIVAALYRMRKEREREIEKLRVKIANDLHDDVGSSLWSITMLSRILSQQGDLAPESRNDVSEINRIAVQTSNSIRDIIWLINPSFDSMHELVLRVKDSAAISLRGMTFNLNTEGIDLTTKMPPHVRQNLLFLIKEALTNVAKHARAKEVDFKAQDLPEHWEFTITDDGIGFNASTETSGTGLKSMQTRAARMDGFVQVQSKPGKGTKLIIMVPKQRPGAFWRLGTLRKSLGFRWK